MAQRSRFPSHQGVAMSTMPENRLDAAPRSAKERVMTTLMTLMHDTAHEKRAMSSRVEAVGRELTRYGLVVVVGWIGLMKFTGYEAEGIRPFVANSPLMSWVYGLISVRG